MNQSMLSIIDHQLEGVVIRSSPHQDERPEGEISLVVVHSISLPESHFGMRFVDALFMGILDAGEHGDLDDLSGLKVSAHVVIDREGVLVQYVPFDRRAWHAGVSAYEGRERCNDFSVGIELIGTDAAAFTEAQYRSLASVVNALSGTYQIQAARMAGHSDIAPFRKTDPGPKFDWQRIQDYLL